MTTTEEAIHLSTVDWTELNDLSPHTAHTPEEIAHFELIDLARADVYRWASPEVQSYLRGQIIDEFYIHLASVVADIDCQLADYYANNPRMVEKGDEWKAKAVAVKMRYQRRLQEIKAVIKSRNVAEKDERLKLREAIAIHRAETQEADFEPSVADLELWAVLESDG